MAARRSVVDLFTMSAGDLLDRWFEAEPLKACLGFDAVVGNFATPYAQGTGYVLLHHVFGEVNGKKGVWGHAIGGMGSITSKMAEACRENGVELRTEAAVREVILEGARAIGVALDTGETLRAERVIANVNPKLLF